MAGCLSKGQKEQNKYFPSAEAFGNPSALYIHTTFHVKQLFINSRLGWYSNWKEK
jgi:hypothetical protein